MTRKKEEEKYLKGKFRVHTVTGTPNFRQIWDVCIFTFVLYHCMCELKSERNLHSYPRSTTNRHWVPMFEKKSPSPVIFFTLMIMANHRYDTQHIGNLCLIYIVVHCAHWLIKCSQLPLNKHDPDPIWPCPICRSKLPVRKQCLFLYSEEKNLNILVIACLNQWNSPEGIYLCLSLIKKYWIQWKLSGFIITYRLSLHCIQLMHLTNHILSKITLRPEPG